MKNILIKLRKALKKLGMTQKNITSVKVTRVITEYWGISKFKDYLKCPNLIEGELVNAEFTVISGDPKKVGKKIKF
jgi:hypothetical protein